MERDGRYPASAEIGTGGEIVPADPELRDTVTNPDYVTLDASRDRLALANLAGVLELALDASDTVAPKNSLEKMLVHQMAVLHRQMMKLAARMDDFVLPTSDHQQRTEEVCRLGWWWPVWRHRISLACSPCNVSAPAASRSLRSSTCMSLTVDRRFGGKGLCPALAQAWPLPRCAHRRKRKNKSWAFSEPRGGIAARARDRSRHFSPTQNFIDTDFAEIYFCVC